jgi:hypothetical protein
MLTRILNTAESFFGGQLPVDFHSKVAIKDKAKIQQDQSDITDKLEAKTNVIICVTEDLIQTVDGLFFFDNTKRVQVGGVSEEGVHTLRISDNDLSRFHDGLKAFLIILEKFGAIPSHHRDLQENLTQKLTAEWIDKHPMWPNRPAVDTPSSIPIKLAVWTSKSNAAQAHEDVVVQFKGARGEWSYPQTFFTGGLKAGGEVKTMATDLGFMGEWPSSIRMSISGKDGLCFWKLMLTSPDGRNHMLMLSPEGEDGAPPAGFSLDSGNVSTATISIPPCAFRTKRDGDGFKGSGVWAVQPPMSVDGKARSPAAAKRAVSTVVVGRVSGQVSAPRSDRVRVVALLNGATAFLQPYTESPKAGLLLLSAGWKAHDEAVSSGTPFSGSGFAKPSYKVVNGVCHLVGVASGSGLHLARLPANCWPSKRLVFQVCTGDSAAAGGTASVDDNSGKKGKKPVPKNGTCVRLDVTMDGTLTCADSKGPASFISLDGISFTVRAAPAAQPLLLVNKWQSFGGEFGDCDYDPRLKLAAPKVGDVRTMVGDDPALVEAAEVARAEAAAVKATAAAAAAEEAAAVAAAAQVLKAEAAAVAEPKEGEAPEATEKRVAEWTAKKALEKEAEAKAKKEAEGKAAKDAEEQAAKEAEEQAKKEAEANAAKEAEDMAKKEAEEQAAKEAEAKATKEAEEQAAKEAEAAAVAEPKEGEAPEATEKRIAEWTAKKEAEEQAKKEAEEQAKQAAAPAPEPEPVHMEPAIPAPKPGTCTGCPSYELLDGVCHLEGLIRGGSLVTGQEIAILPAACRPQRRLAFTQPVKGKGGSGSCRIDVSPDCSVRWVGGVNDKNEWLSLSGISFLVASEVESPHWVSSHPLFASDRDRPIVGSHVHHHYELTNPSGPSCCSTIVRPDNVRVAPLANGVRAFLQPYTAPGLGDADRIALFAAAAGSQTGASGVQSTPRSLPLELGSGCEEYKEVPKDMVTLDGTKWTQKPAEGLAEWGTPSCRVSAGVCRAQGVVRVEAAWTKNEHGRLATLPEGCRPVTHRVFTLDNNGSPCRVDVHPNGDIEWMGGSRTASFVSLDGIVFPLDEPVIEMLAGMNFALPAIPPTRASAGWASIVD